MTQVTVRFNNIDHALRMLKKKMQREGLFKEMKKRKHFIKPSEEKVLRAEESMRRRRKARSRREGE